jgi:Family of unknown function (DUF6055)
MKQLIIIVGFLIAASNVFAVEDSLALSRERQLQIVQDYMIATGQTTEFERKQLYSDDEGNPLVIKCGTAAVLDFQVNREKIDPSILKSLGTAIVPRPSGLPLTYVSPSGRFLIHYDKTGAKACYQPNVDSDADGVPNYVESVAIIADSIYTNIITVMGYPAPSSDSLDAGYNGGGDAKHDIYLDALGANYYGLTYADSIRIDGPTGRKASSFLVLDRDYQLFPVYADRPLDAVRVTTAHEYFHAVQFGIDVFEAETNGPIPKPYWMEMSAVWMEEQLYDNINDYYGYLTTFFNNPTLSLQQFSSGFDFHPYASVVFPLFLSEEYGADIIRRIWVKCGEGFFGQSFLVATEAVTDSIHSNVGTWPFVFAKFTAWNYFTGSRGVWAPTGVGYAERDDYPEIPADSILRFSGYPFFRQPNTMPRLPEHNGTFYFELDSTRAMEYDTNFPYVFCQGKSLPNCNQPYRKIAKHGSKYFYCTAGSFTTTCSDSMDLDTVFGVGGLDTGIAADTFLPLFVALDPPGFPRPWGLSVFYRFAANTDSFEVNSGTVPQGTSQALLLTIPHPRQYKNIVFAVSPASTDVNFYSYNRPPPAPRYDVGLSSDDKLDSSLFGPPNPAEVNLPAELFYPFPNPAVVSELANGAIVFRLQVPTDDIAHYVVTRPLLHLDIYNVAGEYVDEAESVIEIPISEENRRFIFDVSWVVGNSAGKEIASGAYIAIARLYANSDKKELLVERTTKVAIIR